MIKRIKISSFATAGLSLSALLAGVNGASAATLDLTTTTSGTIEGAQFYRSGYQPTGSGVIQSFLVVGGNQDVVEGYNSNLPNNQLQFNEKAGTNALKLSDVPIINLNGTTYYGFLLDINQLKSDPLLSVDSIQIYQTSTGTPTGFDPTSKSFSGGSYFLAYDIDKTQDYTIELDYSLGSGSGSGDMLMYVPTAYFTSSNQYVTMYTKFGQPNNNNDGFEEWATFDGTGTPPSPGPVPAPLPTSAMAGVALLGCYGLGQRRRSSPKPA